MVDELDLLRQLIDADPVSDDPRLTDRLVERVMTQAAVEFAGPAVPPRGLRQTMGSRRLGRGADPVRSGKASSRQWYRARWLGGSVIAALLAAAGGSVAYAELAGSRAPTYLGEARCYSVASLKGGDNFYGLTVTASGRPGSAAVVTNALQTCTVDWQQGFLALGQRPLRVQLPPDKRVHPHLVACVLPTGIAAVFPGNVHTCQQLGLSSEERASSG